jgi:hypothetical protein
MPFDPTLPATNSPIVSAELRNQFNALKELIDAKPSSDDVLLAINQNASANTNNIETLDLAISDPPTQSEVQAVVQKLNDLINQLAQPSV